MVVGLGPATVGMRSIENLTSSAVKSEPSWNFTPRRSLNSQVVSLIALPAFGQPRLELQPVARPDQRIEHMLQRLGVRAGRGEVRIDRVGPPRTPMVRVWAEADVTNAVAHNKPMTNERMSDSPEVWRGADRAPR